MGIGENNRVKIGMVGGVAGISLESSASEETSLVFTMGVRPLLHVCVPGPWNSLPAVWHRFVWCIALRPLTRQSLSIKDRKFDKYRGRTDSSTSRSLAYVTEIVSFA